MEIAGYAKKRAIEIFFSLMFAVAISYGQTFTVRGKITTTTGPVRYASVTYIDQNDTTRRYSAITDTSGSYQLDVVTSVKPPDNLPTKFELEQNYPNPFNPSTTIGYDIPEREHVILTIYDVLGRLVKTLVNAEISSGHYEVHFDASRLSSGLYFYRLQAGTYVQTKKLTVVK